MSWRTRKKHSNKDKGVEMDNDFEADTFSMNEDSEDSVVPTLMRIKIIIWSLK